MIVSCHAQTGVVHISVPVLNDTSVRKWHQRWNNQTCLIKESEAIHFTDSLLDCFQFCVWCLMPWDVVSQSWAFFRTHSSALPVWTLDFVADPVCLQVHASLVYPEGQKVDQAQVNSLKRNMTSAPFYSILWLPLWQTVMYPHDCHVLHRVLNLYDSREDLRQSGFQWQTCHKVHLICLFFGSWGGCTRGKGHLYLVQSLIPKGPQRST